MVWKRKMACEHVTPWRAIPSFGIVINGSQIRKSEVGGWKSEVRSSRTEVGNLKLEIESQKSGSRKSRVEVGSQKRECRNRSVNSWKSEIGSQEARKLEFAKYVGSW